MDIESYGQKGMLYQSMKAHFKDGVEWDQTIAYQKVVEGDAKWRGIDSETEFQDRCEHVEELYQAIQSDGFKTQEELKGKKPRKPSEVKVAIGREGDFLYVNGKHRLLIAKLLSLDKIPVNVTLRHPQWQAYRDEIITIKLSKQKSITATHYKDHPDIEYLI